ncbi:MAG: hypothetical protein PVG71_02825, partial [Anaerolineae bacterium]
MKTHTLRTILKVPIFRLMMALILMSLLAAPPTMTLPADGPMVEMIVQGSDVATVAALVEGIGGEVTHELGIIDAVGARLTQG